MGQTMRGSGKGYPDSNIPITSTSVPYDDQIASSETASYIEISQRSENEAVEGKKHKKYIF